MKNEQKEIDKDLKLLVKSSMVVFIGIFLSKLLAYAYRIIIARHFGPEVYGLFSLALIVLGLFVAFSSFGLGGGLLRFISLYRGEKNIQKIRYVFRFATKISVLSGIIFGLILFLTSDFIASSIFHNSELAIFLKYFSILVTFGVVSGPYLTSLRAYEKIGWHSAIHNIFPNIAKVLFLILFLFIGINSNSIIFSYMCGIFIYLIFSYFACRYVLPEIFEKFILKKETQKKISKNLIKYSTPLLFFGIFSTVFYWTDSFLIGYFKTAVEVGLYNSAVPIAMLFAIVPELFMQLFFPLITKEYSKKNFKAIKELSKQVSKWIFILNLPIFILISFFPGAIINILFGAEYLFARDALRFLSLSAFFASIFIVSNQLIFMAGKSRLILFDIILALILNIFLNYILIPMNQIWFIENPLGITGAAIATMISVIFFNCLFFFQARHYLGIVPLRKKMFSIALASLVPTLLLLYLRHIISINIISIILLSIFFILTYILSIIVVRGLDKNDKMIFHAIKKKLLQRN